MTTNSQEIVYVGFNVSAVAGGEHAVFRIKDLAGNIVFPETTVPAAGVGHINNITEARNGPFAIYGTGGYSAIDWHPPYPNTFYLEFQEVNNSSGLPQVSTTGFNLNLFDLTVYDSVVHQIKLGRLYSKAWQFYETNRYSGTNYIYSFDSIITSATFNTMQGGVWVQFCNQWGCANTGNFPVDRKSLHAQQAYMPQYVEFLNPPDSILFPAAQTLGLIVAPLPWGDRNCNNGNILFHVFVNKTGAAEIDLTFPLPYTARILTNLVTIGENLINWDGKDGSGVNVPNNVLVTFTVKYVNGLTNLPLYDVEGNPNGFTIGLVRPPGATPLVFWDDTNIPGPPAGTANLTGCLSPPGCHTWPGTGQGWGNENTINTWWYNTSISTTAVTINEYRGPQPLVILQVPPQNYCPGTTGVYFSVTPDPNADEYHWSYSGAGATITHLNPGDPFITVDFALNATNGNIQVYGSNINCNNPGQTTFLAITIKPIPSVNPPYSKTICSGTNTGIVLSSTPPGGTFSWTSPFPTCSANILACPFGLNNQVSINDILSVTDLNPGSVIYHLTPSLNGCSGPVKNDTVTVSPLPDVIITSTTPTICSGQTTNIHLSSTIPTSTFTWTASPTSINLSGFPPSGSGDIILTITNSGFTTESILFTITPTNNGCVNSTPTPYTVTVFPIPNLFINLVTPTICSGQTANILLSSQVLNTTFNWTATPSSLNLTGFAPAGSGNIAQTITNTGYTIETVTFNITPVANGCNGIAQNTVVTVYPRPDLSNSPLNKQICSNSPTNITLTSNVAGTLFTWTATPSSVNVSGYNNNSIPTTLLDQTLINTGFAIEFVTYHITPRANGCDGLVTDFVVTVYPVPNLSNVPKSEQICNNTSTNLTLTSNVAGTLFIWTAVPSSPNVTGFSDNSIPTISLNQVLVNSGFNIETVTYHITPRANGCDGPVTDYIITVNPVPDLSTNPLAKQLCTNTSTNITLTSNVNGTLFTWTCTPSSGNITGFSNNGIPTIFLNQTLINTGFNIESVTYHITPHANNCTGILYDFVFTVYPLPNLSNIPLNKQLCNNSNTNLNLTSNVSGTLFTWTATPSSGNIAGYTNNNIPSVLLDDLLINSGFAIETVTYHIIPNANGCDGNLTDYIVTIYPTPDLSNTPLDEQICNTASTGITLTSNVNGTLFTWTATPSSGNVIGFSNNGVPTTVLNQVLTNTSFVDQTVTYHISPHANGCDGIVYDFVVTVYPQADLSNTPLNKQLCSGSSTNLNLTSDVAGTLFTWTCTPSSGNVGGWSNNSNPTTTLNQTLINSGFLIETVIYHITANANGCSGNTTDYVVTVYPVPDLSNTPLNESICKNQNTNLILTSYVAGTLFTWTCTGSSGFVTGYSDNAIPTILLNQVLYNNNNIDEFVTYHITPHANGCDGPLTDYVVTVRPRPILTVNPMFKTICSGDPVNIVLQATCVGTTFSWVPQLVTGNVTGYASGSGPVINDILTNNINTAGVVTYTVSFQASGCTGNDTVYTVNVNPTPHVTTNPLAASMCSGSTTNISLVSDVAGASFSYIATGSSPNVTGFSGGINPLITQTLTNTGFNIETVTYHITPTANGCSGPIADYVVTVFPVPDLSNTPPSEQICNNQSTNLTLTSHVAGTLFTWTCTPSSGNVSGFSNNNIPATFLNQTLVNSGFSIEAVTYHMTPHANGCDGTVTDFVVTLVSKPDLINNPPAKQICNNTSTNITLTSNVNGTLFTWTATGSSGNVSGYSNNSIPAIILNQTLSNSSFINQTVTYHIVPHANGCDGDTTGFVVTVYPTPDLTNNPLAKSQCNNNATNILLTSDVAGTQFTWTCTPSSGNISGFSNNAIPTVLLNQTLVNSGFSIETVTYHLTPQANNCNGSVYHYVVTVFPTADVYFIPANQTICSQQTTNIQILSHVAGATFSWTATPSSVNLSGFSGGNVNVISQTITNSGNTIETITYHATPTANNCTGTPADVKVTVNPTPLVTTAPLNQTICAGFTTAINLTSSVAGSTFAWTMTSSSPNLSGFSPGSGFTINQTIANSGFTIENVSYYITPTANSCPGPVSTYVVTVNPTPDVSNNPLTAQICSSTSPNIGLLSHVTGATFSWSASGSSPNITGYSPGNGLVINQVLINTGFNTETVTYHITPTANGCVGPSKDFVVTVFPVPDVYFNPVSQTLCSNQTTNIQNLSHVAGTTFTWTASPSSGNLSGFSGGSGNLIAQTLFNSGSTIETVIYTVTPQANGCPPGLSHTVIITVDPRPAVTNNITSFQICSATNITIPLQSNVAGTTFAWTASGSSPNVTGFSAGSGPVILQNLINSGFNIETVIYIVTPTANGCAGTQAVFTVTVFPVADVYFTPAGQAFCSGGTTNLNLASHVAGASFTWTATGSSPNVTGFSPGSGTLIQQTLINSGYMSETVNYAANPTANGCPGAISHGIVTVNPWPVVSLTTCWDPVITADAQPVKLKGGIPLGGAYSGAGVNAGIFYPGIAGAGIFTINYSYTNGFGCSNNSSQTITVISPVAFTCGNVLTDVRDNNQYSTVQFGNQCWMAANLNFGTTILSSQMQRDNCISEKYCFDDIPVNCSSTGGLYQWDELMKFDNNNGAQGFCPPGWHIPKETDWNALFDFYVSNGFAGSALKFTGFSGFDAFLSGVRHENATWRYNNFAIMFWSSTAHGSTKAWAHGMNSLDPSVSYYPSLRANAFPVRCIKD